jgi:hypothetical protein
VFGASEQKCWYEVLHFHFDSTAIRCRHCRRQRRTDKAIRQALATAIERSRANPRDPAAHIEVARTTVEFFERLGQGNLDRGIAHARKAQKLTDALPEALFWEASCHRLSQREQKSKELLERFAASSSGKNVPRHMIKSAKQALQSIS